MLFMKIENGGNFMKKALVSLILVSALALSFASCGKEEKETAAENTTADISEATESTESTTEPVELTEDKEDKTEIQKETTKQTESKAAENVTYVSAYKNYLSKYSENLDGELPEYFSLHYVDDDDIPELFVAQGESHGSGVMVLTFDGKEVKELGTAGRFGMLGFGKRQGLIVETNTAKCNIISTVYKIENGELKECWEGDHQLGGYPSEDTPEGYISNGEKVDKATYEKDLEKYMPETVFMNRETADAEEFPTVKFAVDGKQYEINSENIAKYIK